MAPCVIFEAEHLLVVNKPAGMNTHAPAPFAGEGIYEWLKHREPRWSSLAIIHRLELPQGRFERRVRLPPGRYSAVRRSEFNGSLLVTLQKSETSNG